MALIKCDFFSEALGMSTSMHVILPQNTQGQIGMNGAESKDRYPVLYLLHGLSDDDSIWCRRTSIERYVSELGIIVVMPNVGRGFYTDMEKGYKYFTFISEELPKVVASFFHVSDKREDTYVAGLSMGGYGAYKLALTYPERYAAAASLSGAMNIMETKHLGEEFNNIFGDEKNVLGSKNDLYYLVQELDKKNIQKPRLFQCCGTEDFLYQDNIDFKNMIEKRNFDYTYFEEPGIHEWGFWDRNIQKVLDWMLKK
ncbi:alpha/beta hydrolase [Clostridium oryzae]|uniref:S-formylglutathione hydrolase YeiG n=1 Tax=Clostridium oryzae TaxID=1450648 RepID=A0A1V4ILC3_9CLOT|nr:alpha/beta hydrolase family protein [Clostridium oryzae]OPJ60838.1 S-formylglutathione hydrolase YeiG [Clostridium oryzae]